MTITVSRTALVQQLDSCTTEMLCLIQRLYTKALCLLAKSWEKVAIWGQCLYVTRRLLSGCKGLIHL